MRVPLASHQISTHVVPAADVYVGGLWAMSLLANFPTVVAVTTGILAGVYYLLCIIDKIKERFRKEPPK